MPGTSTWSGSGQIRPDGLPDFVGIKPKEKARGPISSATPVIRSNGGTRGSSGRSGQRGGATTSGRTSGSEPEAWAVWWRHNRDAFLWDVQVDAAPRGPHTAAGRSGVSSRTDTPASAIPHAPSPAQVDAVIVPALRERLEAEQDGGALAEVVLALGRVARGPSAQPVSEALFPLLADEDTRVAESAAVALGLLASEDGRAALHELAACSQVGHALSGRSRVPDSLRMVATVALGLLGDGDSSARLRHLAEGGRDVGPGLQASAALAVGLVGPGGDGDAAAWLGAWSHDRRLPLDLQVSLATSLGRLDHDGAVPALMDILADRDVDAPTRQAALASLGRAARLDDEPVVDTLVKAYKKDRDAGTRQLALLSLARLATAEPSTEGGRDARRAIDKLVRKELRRPSRSLDRPFTALAAGLLLRGRPELRQDLGPILLEAYEDASAPELRGAFALGLGLGRVTDGAKALRADLMDSHDEDLQGHLAVALGLLADVDAAPLLQERLLTTGRSPSARSDLATGLRLLDDRDTVIRVAAAYRGASNGAERTALAAALGALRHGDGVDALLAVCGDDEQDAASRASACAALGRLAETSAEPFTARLTRDGAPAHAHAAVLALAGR